MTSSDSWVGRRFETLDAMLGSEDTGWFKVPEDWPQYQRVGARWYIRATSGVFMLPWIGVGMITGTHWVIEHPDGTITVEPSLVMPNGWHGWLREGVFTNA